FQVRCGDRPAILVGLAAETRAYTEWTENFFSKLKEEDVNVVLSDRVAGKTVRWKTTMKLGDFIAELPSREGMYLSEWYLFRRHPEFLDDVAGRLPDYLKDDWLEVLPPRWQLGPGARNNVYWGGRGTWTACHYDSVRTVTVTR